MTNPETTTDDCMWCRYGDQPFGVRCEVPSCPTILGQLIAMTPPCGLSWMGDLKAREDFLRKCILRTAK